jgi:hypothetical protein
MRVGLRLTLLAAAALLGCAENGVPAFQTVTSEQPGALLSAFVTSNGTAYLVGGVTGGGAGLVLRWDGHGITTIPTPDARAFWWIHGVSDSEMYISGEGGEVHRFDGASLTLVDAGAPAQSTLYGVWGGSGDDLWIVGGAIAGSTTEGVVRHLAGGSWADVPLPAGVDPSITYFKVWGPAASDVWVVGERGVVLRDVGGAGLVQVDAPPAERYVTVNGCGPSDVYVVGGIASGSTIHYDGTAWTSIALADVPPINGVACAGGTAYVGGFFAYAARIAGGASSLVAMPPALADLAIHGVAAGGGRVMAVGGDLVATAAQPQRGFAVELR